MKSSWHTGSDLVELTSGSARVLLDPALGGVVVRYESKHDGKHIPWFQPRGLGCPGTFPLLPFASRIRNGAFQYLGKTVRLAANNLPEVHAIHGHGWQGVWSVHRQTETSVVLEFVYEGGDWPWSYMACQTVQLQEMVLEISLQITNCSQEPMPVGFGLHPYFPLTQECRVDLQVSHEWLLDDELMSDRRVSCADRFTNGVKPARVRLDNVYDGWDGMARITWPENGHCLAIAADSVFARLVAYSPGETYFCMEPVSNVPDAFNIMARGEAHHGVSIIESGEQLSGCVRFSPRAIDNGA